MLKKQRTNLALGSGVRPHASRRACYCIGSIHRVAFIAFVLKRRAFRKFSGILGNQTRRTGPRPSHAGKLPNIAVRERPRRKAGQDVLSISCKQIATELGRQ